MMSLSSLELPMVSIELPEPEYEGDYNEGLSTRRFQRAGKDKWLNHAILLKKLFDVDKILSGGSHNSTITTHVVIYYLKRIITPSLAQ